VKDDMHFLLTLRSWHYFNHLHGMVITSMYINASVNKEPILSKPTSVHASVHSWKEMVK
jgi:hypothetical protein